MVTVVLTVTSESNVAVAWDTVKPSKVLQKSVNVLRDMIELAIDCRGTDVALLVMGNVGVLKGLEMLDEMPMWEAIVELGKVVEFDKVLNPAVGDGNKGEPKLDTVLILSDVLTREKLCTVLDEFPVNEIALGDD